MNLNPPNHDVCCINRGGFRYINKIGPNFKYWYSQEVCWLCRDGNVPDGPWQKWTCQESTFQPQPKLYRLVRYQGRGTSSYNAARTAMEKWGYKGIVFAGVPLSDKYSWYIDNWDIPEVNKISKSLSGLTKDKLGFPTSKWFDKFR